MTDAFSVPTGTFRFFSSSPSGWSLNYCMLRISIKLNRFTPLLMSSTLFRGHGGIRKVKVHIMLSRTSLNFTCLRIWWKLLTQGFLLKTVAASFFKFCLTVICNLSSPFFRNLTFSHTFSWPRSNLRPKQLHRSHWNETAFFLSIFLKLCAKVTHKETKPWVGRNKYRNIISCVSLQVDTF